MMEEDCSTGEKLDDKSLRITTKAALCELIVLGGQWGTLECSRQVGAS